MAKTRSTGRRLKPRPRSRPRGSRDPDGSQEAPASPAQLSALVHDGDGATRESVTTRLQSSAGNAAVQRLIDVQRDRTPIAAGPERRTPIAAGPERRTPIAAGGSGRRVPIASGPFNKATAAGRSVEQAALETWTGERAVAQGYSKVTVVSVEGKPGAYTKVVVRFMP